MNGIYTGYVENENGLMEKSLIFLFNDVDYYSVPFANHDLGTISFYINKFKEKTGLTQISVDRDVYQHLTNLGYRGEINEVI